jgi:NADH:ubiquinone oxidoreductase subunit H
MGEPAIPQRFFELPVGARLLVQALAVILCATIGAFAAGRFRFGSLVNLGWAALLPLLIGILLNRGTTNRITIPVFWVMLSFATIILVSGWAGLGAD